MKNTKEELFLAELGIDVNELIDCGYGAKLRLTSILNDYEKLVNKTNDIHDVMPRESDFKKALELLRDLAEIQNGSPMHKDAEEWQDIMSNIWDFLTTHEA